MTASVTVRTGESSDLSRLREIQAGALAEPCPELLATATDGPLSLLVIEAGTVLGYAIVVPDGERVAYIPEFAVHPDHQREGHGSRLLTELRERLVAADYEQLRLTVRTSDDDARKFYASHGFDRLDRLPDHFENGDGLLLALSLAHESDTTE